MKAIYPHITGVILAGGRSERFGSDKAFTLFQGTSFIERTLAVLKPLFPEHLIITNTPEIYQSFPVTVITDDVPYQGPLGAVTTALRHASHEQVFIVACDMPLLDPQVIAQVIEQGSGFDAAIPIHGERREYLMALYSRRLLASMSTSLTQGVRSLKEFCQGQQLASLRGRSGNITWVPVDSRPCFNVNTKRDLARLALQHSKGVNHAS